MKKDIEDAIEAILRFDKKCSLQEYTDTGDAWILLYQLLEILKRIRDDNAQ